MTTKFLNTNCAREARTWVVVDAANQALGRVSTKVAALIRGKHKTSSAPQSDCGEFVVVINAAKIKLTGNKLTAKKYIKHSQYPGGLKTVEAGTLLAKHPERLIQSAVEGMLPKSKGHHNLARKLKVYAGAEHPHSAQKPTKA